MNAPPGLRGQIRIKHAASERVLSRDKSQHAFARPSYDRDAILSTAATPFAGHLGHARLRPRRCKKWSKLNSLHLGDSLPLEAAALFGASNMNSARGGARTLALPSARRQRSLTVNHFSRRRGSHRTFLLRRSGCLGKRAKPSRHARHFHVAHSSSQCRTMFYLLWSIGRRCLN